MGLGLVVGVAAVGVIAFRSVVERRQQIGVLRALGFQRSHGLASVHDRDRRSWSESASSPARSLGVILARNLFTSRECRSPKRVLHGPVGDHLDHPGRDWSSALLMTWLPSRQAARIAPAEALRYE